MFLEIKNILSKKTLSKVNALIDNATFVDGKASAGKHVRTIKNNKIGIARTDTHLTEANQLLFKEVSEHEIFIQHCFPKKIAPFLFSRYDEGMYYGRHLDNAIFTFGEHLRSDLSMTLFLNDATEYEGGELLVECGGEIKRYKGHAGDLVLYPSGLHHEVTEINKGSRRVAVTWIESLIRNTEQRELLAGLGGLMHQDNPSKEALKDMLTHAYYNLARLWAET